MNAQNVRPLESTWNKLRRIGGAAAIMLFVYSIIVMIVIMVLGVQPASAEETFAMLQAERIVGLLRMDVLTVAAMPLFYLFFAGLCAALWRSHRAYAALAAALAAIGVTLFLSTSSITSLVYLSDRYAAATTEAQRSLYLAAGESVIASDMWHGMASAMGGILMQSAGILFAVLMLRGKVFGKATAIVGILLYVFELGRILVTFVSADAGSLFMIVAGPLNLVWFPLAGRRLLQLGRESM